MGPVVGVRRGDLITVAVNDDCGKPRPALVVQSDYLPETDSILVCPLTTTIRDVPIYRLALPANAATGLRQPSQIMVDKMTAVRRDRCGPPIGQVDSEALAKLKALLAFVLGVAD